MSEFYPANHRDGIMLEYASSSPMQTPRPITQGVLMPFEPHSQEAGALRGAMSFLFMLITVYGELLEQDALAAGDPSGNGESGHR